MVTSKDVGSRSGRRMVTVRLSWAGVEEIDAEAGRDSLDRSAMIRTLLSEALTARRTGRPR